MMERFSNGVKVFLSFVWRGAKYTFEVVGNTFKFFWKGLCHAFNILHHITKPLFNLILMALVQVVNYFKHGALATKGALQIGAMWLCKVAGKIVAFVRS